MKQLIQFNFITILLLVFLSACSTMPPVDTMNKKLAFVEISYQEIITTAKLWRAEGRLSLSERAALTSLFNKMDNALILAKAAKAVGSQGEFNNSLAILSVTLTGLRTILTEVKQ